jgi:hypothetical protein
MDKHLVALGGDWALRRDFAVRSAGFPVAGLDLFGADDEQARLRDIAADPAFREAVAWQNRDVLASAVDGLLDARGAPSKDRRREEIVARYWQRYLREERHDWLLRAACVGRASRRWPRAHATLARPGP